MLYPKQQEIKECIEEYNLCSVFCVVINLTDNPIISFPKEFIQLASNLDAVVDVDSYLDFDKEDKPILKRKALNRKNQI